MPDGGKEHFEADDNDYVNEEDDRPEVKKEDFETNADKAGDGTDNTFIIELTISTGWPETSKTFLCQSNTNYSRQEIHTNTRQKSS